QGNGRELVAGYEPGVDRMILPDDLVGPRFRREQLCFGSVAAEVDRRIVGAEMKGRGFEVEQFLEGGGQEVLAVMLLHEVESSQPVHSSFNGIHGQVGIEGMPDG